MSSQSIRVGLVGCGYQGQWLARAAAAIPALEIVACADPDQAAAQQVTGLTPSAQVYDSAEDLVDRAPVDAVMVATPHHLLQPYSLLAVNAGKHVLAEKPVGLNGAETAQLVDAVAKTGVTFMAGYSFRYFSEPNRAHQLLSDGAAGRIQSISAGFGRGPMRGGWKADPRSGGGPMLFIGVHIVDHILWFVNDRPVEVYADVRTRRETGVDETSSFQIRFEHGATAHCLVTDAADGWFYYLHAIGDAGQIHLAFDDFPNYSLTVRKAGEESTSERTPGDRNRLVLAKMTAELAGFAGAIQKGGDPPITVHDAHAVMEVLDAVSASAAGGQPVLLPRKDG